MKLITIVAVLIFHSAVKAEDTQSEDNDINVKECKNLALDIKDAAMKTGESIWLVHQVTTIDQTSTIPDLNICSTVSFFKDFGCDTIRVTRKAQEGGKSTVTTEAENTTFNNIAIYQEKFERVSKTDYIFRGSVTKMQLLDITTKKTEDVNPIPDIVKEVQEQLYALVNLDKKNDNWTVYCTCSKKVCWTLIKELAYTDPKKKDTVIGEIEMAVKSLAKDHDVRISLTEVDKNMPVEL